MNWLSTVHFVKMLLASNDPAIESVKSSMMSWKERTSSSSNVLRWLTTKVWKNVETHERVANTGENELAIINSRIFLGWSRDHLR
mmetsp:Transcript_32328/g.48762  ORF Transcript_32328/g.48762 Transcript_32328/m.48762 type:complete len:85 (-) Transcript_32328:131-385(-)